MSSLNKDIMLKSINMPSNTNKIIDEFVAGVRKILGKRIKKIILYGSYARGDFNGSSDVDIMILTDLTNNEIEEYSEKIVDFAYDIEWNNDFNINLSPIIKNIDNFNYWLKTIPFYMNVQKEGVEL